VPLFGNDSGISVPAFLLPFLELFVPFSAAMDGLAVGSDCPGGMGLVGPVGFFVGLAGLIVGPTRVLGATGAVVGRIVGRTGPLLVAGATVGALAGAPDDDPPLGDDPPPDDDPPLVLLTRPQTPAHGEPPRKKHFSPTFSTNSLFSASADVHPNDFILIN
jgi:hypothetical protein